MKKIFYYAAMVLAASAVMVSCQKDDPTNDPDDGDGGGTPRKTRLATPDVSASVDAEAGTVTISWEAIQNAVSYEYRLNEGSSTSVTETTVTLQTADYSAGDYTVEVRAIPEEDSELYNESNWGSATFTLEAADVEPSEELLPWLGTYTAQSTGTVVFSVTGENMVSISYDDNATMDFNVTIEPMEGQSDYVLVYGFSGISGVPALATLLADETGTSVAGLAIVTEIGFLDDGQGGALAWYGIATSNGQCTYVTGPQWAYYFPNLSDGKSISVPYQGEFTNGNEFTMIAADLAGLSGNNIMLYYESYPVNLPAGTFTLTKTSDTYSVVKNAPEVSVPKMLAAPAYSVR